MLRAEGKVIRKKTHSRVFFGRRPFSLFALAKNVSTKKLRFPRKDFPYSL